MIKLSPEQLERQLEILEKALQGKSADEVEKLKRAWNAQLFRQQYEFGSYDADAAAINVLIQYIAKKRREEAETPEGILKEQAKALAREHGVGEVYAMRYLKRQQAKPAPPVEEVVRDTRMQQPDDKLGTMRANARFDRTV